MVNFRKIGARVVAVARDAFTRNRGLKAEEGFIRMVLPLTYFMEKPFQNWTRESASLIGSVMIYVDYATPVAASRGPPSSSPG